MRSHRAHRGLGMSVRRAMSDESQWQPHVSATDGQMEAHKAVPHSQVLTVGSSSCRSFPRRAGASMWQTECSTA